MQASIHPDYTEITVTCACGSEFQTRSTLKQDLLKIDLCSQCHPFFTGTQKIVDSTGRVERFTQKYGAIDLAKLAKKRR